MRDRFESSLTCINEIDAAYDLLLRLYDYKVFHTKNCSEGDDAAKLIAEEVREWRLLHAQYMCKTLGKPAGKT